MININSICIQDNLELMKSMDNNFIDLIYLDPPFNSGDNYRYANKDEIAFKDVWKLGVMSNEHWNNVYTYSRDLFTMIYSLSEAHSDTMGSYLMYMSERLIHMHRILKDTGSLYLHVDDSAVHYLKVIMDFIFGGKNFINEIIWQRTKGGKGSASKPRKFGRNVDHILLYAKDIKKHIFNHTYIQLSKEELEKKFSRIDENDKRYRTDHIEVHDGVKGGGCHYTFNGYTPKRGWFVKESKLIQMNEENRLYWSSTSKPYRKYFMDEYPGKIVDNLWLDINIAKGKEDTGYPTQKPLDLLRRIVLASSNEGDLVFDPFCGSGTTLIAAKELGRNYIGCDINEEAINIAEDRLCKISM